MYRRFRQELLHKPDGEKLKPAEVSGATGLLQVLRAVVIDVTLAEMQERVEKLEEAKKA